MPFSAKTVHLVDTCGISLVCPVHHHPIRYMMIERFTDCGVDYALHTLHCVDCLSEEDLKNLTTPNMKLNIWTV